jgi:hypothetical protein
MGILTVIVYVLIALNSCSSTPFDDYINAPDSVFSWKRLQTYPQGTHTLYVLNMTSQQWFDGKTISQKNVVNINLFFRNIFITLNLVALYDYCCAQNDSSFSNCLVDY